MERKENLFQPPEYTAEMFSEYFENTKARALRASEIEAILGDDYDLDRLRELVEADRNGRCVVLPVEKIKDRESLFDALSEAVSALPSADVAPVVHGTPVLRYRPERYERYDDYGLNENGEMLYLKRVLVDEKSYAMYCPACGKRLCSRFRSFCPNCGAKMDGAN